MTAPITYIPDFVPDAAEAFTALQTELNWEQRDAPRQEYYCNDTPNPYVYGRGKGERLYNPQPYHPVILSIRAKLESLTGTVFDVCFLNRYLNQGMHLGWHSDNSPEMDDARPIGVVSLGAEREIWFRLSEGANVAVEKLMLGHGSLVLMAPECRTLTSIEFLKQVLFVAKESH